MSGGIGVLLVLALAACAQVSPECSPQAPSYTRTVDLSHVVREDVPYLQGEPYTVLSRDAEGRLVQLAVGLRTGSLLQVAAAPGAELTFVDALSPRDLVLPAVVIDARDLAADAAGFTLTAGDVVAWERANGPVPRGAMVLLATGWDLHWGDPDAYLNSGPDGTPRVPGYAAAAADLLLNQRGAAGLGIDAPLALHVPAAGFALLLANLTSLEQLPPTGTTLVIGALKLQHAQSSPARVLALIP